MVRNFLFWNCTSPFRELTCQANSDFLARFFCTGQQQLWRGQWNFKTKILAHFSSSFLSQKCWGFFSTYSRSSRWCDWLIDLWVLFMNFVLLFVAVCCDFIHKIYSWRTLGIHNSQFNTGFRNWTDNLHNSDVFRTPECSW